MMEKVFYGWWIILACTPIGLCTSGLVHYSFTAFFEPLVKEFGWSYAQVSFAVSLRGLEMSIFAPVIGFLVDRLGPKKLIFCGTITIGFGLICLSLTRSLAMFYASFLLLAFGGGGCATIVLVSTAANWFSKNAGKAIAIITCAFGAGGFIVPLVVRLIDCYGWRTALIVLAAGMWTLGIPLSLVIRDKPERYGYLPDGELPHDDPMVQSKNKAEESEIGFKEAVKQRAFLYLVMVDLIRSMIASAVVTHVMPYFSSVGIARSTAGMVAAAIPLLSILGRFGFGWLGDVYNKKYMMAAAQCLMGLGLLAFCYVQHRWVILVFLLLFCPGCWGGMVLTRTIQREYFGRHSFGKILGIIMGASSLGGIIGPVLAGWVFDTLRSYHFIWLVFSGFSVLCIWFISRMKPSSKTSAEF
ncbi:MAG: MFS transporter [Thermodesulfobacteriota bacterium]